jgi:hypothetical protein
MISPRGAQQSAKVTVYYAEERLEKSLISSGVGLTLGGLRRSFSASPR